LGWRRRWRLRQGVAIGTGLAAVAAGISPDFATAGIISGTRRGRLGQGITARIVASTIRPGWSGL
jgi:hypothetical protein